VTPEELAETIRAAVGALVDERALVLADGLPQEVRVERPRVREHGDYATNVALQLAKPAGLPPRELAGLLAKRLTKAPGIASAKVAGPGFLNLVVDAGAQAEVVTTIVAAGPTYGQGEALAGQRLNLEFVSVNPTGPVTLGHTRWAAVGDAIARLLRAQGAEVVSEYYFNDHGAQIDRFAASLLARARGRPAPEGGYVGAYLDDIVADILLRRPDLTDLPEHEALEVCRAEGVDLMFSEIKQSLHDFGVDFDVYFHEQSLHERGQVAEAVERLRASGLTYESDGALWLRSTEYGDDKDRVLVRRDGRPTYICADAAYYLDKRGRGFDRVLILLGADHHGYVGRYRALAAAFGDDPDQHLELLIGQMVNLVRNGVPVRMSKRAGNVIRIDDMVEAIGVDAGRYALARYSTDSTIEIDLDLWTRQTSDNPVFYVQYAHARLASILRNAEELGITAPGADFDPALLSHEREGDLVRALAEYPRIAQQAALLREPHRVARYLEELAATFHRFYDVCRVLPMGDEPVEPLHRARLALVEASRVVFGNGLSLLGVSAPERM
jgi:arginyl-tRNA synthetase